jgi:hypothetical protein
VGRFVNTGGLLKKTLKVMTEELINVIRRSAFVN